MSFNAQLRSDIETLDVTINNYERMANAPEAWDRIKKALEAVHSTSDNKDMFQLLSGIKAMLDGKVKCELTPDSQFHEKLNAVLTQQKHV